MTECIYSLSMKLAWREDSARLLSSLFRGVQAAANLNDLAMPQDRGCFQALNNAILQHVSGLDFCSVTLEYARRWRDLQKSLTDAQAQPPSLSKPMFGQKDPYRSNQLGEYRMIDLYLAGMAPLLAAGFFSVGAAKPHSRAKISLLFQEVGKLMPSIIWWRIGPQEEHVPLSIEETLRSDTRLVAL